MKAWNKEKKKEQGYIHEIIAIGMPVTLQSIFQASYSFVDQLMVGTLGTICIAGSGIGGKFSSLVSFTMASIATAASILIAQYHGNHDAKGINKSFFVCSYLMLLITLLFAIPGILVPQGIMRIYSNETEVVYKAAEYLRIIAISYIPMGVTLMLSALFRSIEKSRYPMYASVLSLFLNIVFNYIFIFGKMGIQPMGLRGAALGTLFARGIEAFILLLVFVSQRTQEKQQSETFACKNYQFYRKVIAMIIPIIINEFSWSVGENIYAAVYGRMGMDSLAAMTLTNPIQGLFIGMFSGISAAAGVMVGKRLGQNDKEEAYHISKYLIKVGLIGSLCISVVLIVLAPFYVTLFQIEPEVQKLTVYIMYSLAAVIFAKILNMILAGGIIRSGGDTQYTLEIDLIGTWIFGVPFALISAFVFHLPIYLVYFIISMEEVIRLIIGVHIFRKKIWMKSITEESF